MKVAYYIGSLNRGGAETLLLDLFQRWEDLPYDAVCLYRKEGTLSENFKQTGVPMARLPKMRSWISYLLRLRQFLVSEHIDIVHAQTSLNALLAILATFATNSKVVTTFHSMGLADRKKRLLCRFICRGSSRIIFVSDFEREHYFDNGCKRYAYKSKVVHNGINFDKIATRSVNQPFHQPLRMCMVGNFGEGRNHLFVCRFLKQLKENGTAFQFSFIGAPRQSELNLYEQCVSFCRCEGLDDCVSFLGMRNDVPTLLSSMDAFIYASRHDTFGIAVIEAIAAGLPTFVNDWGVMNELTCGGKYAAIYPTEDIDSFVTLFLSTIKDQQSTLQAAQYNALAIRDRFGIKKHTENLHQIYKQIIQ